MDTERTLIEALHADPSDRACWLALADWLEEDGQSPRGELLRLRLGLQELSWHGRAEREQRLCQLLAGEVRPVVPVLKNSLGMELALIPAGAFWMGSSEDEPGRHFDEGPRHEVELTEAFYLGVFPVTQAQYQSVMGTNPSHFRVGGEGAPLVRGMDTSTFPAERVSWNDAAEFCQRLSARPEERAAGRVFRLPSEAEWEYACRAGTTTMFAFGESLTVEQSNIDSNWPREAERSRPLARTCAVGRYVANAFGLHDMHGNVWEWCSDWFDEHYYRSSPREDPPGRGWGVRRATRGGSWFHSASLSRSAYRYRYEPDVRANEFGMRVAMSLPK